MLNLKRKLSDCSLIIADNDSVSFGNYNAEAIIYNVGDRFQDSKNGISIDFGNKFFKDLDECIQEVFDHTVFITKEDVYNFTSITKTNSFKDFTNAIESLEGIGAVEIKKANNREIIIETNYQQDNEMKIAINKIEPCFNSFFYAAHRLLHYKGKCKNLHGHSYITPNLNSGFGDLHNSFLINKDDEQLIKFCESNNFKYVLFNGNSTCENILKKVKYRFDSSENTILLKETMNSAIEITEEFINY